jgi:hypothetical protein
MYLCSGLSSLAGGSVLSHEFDLVVAQSDVVAVPQSGVLRASRSGDTAKTVSVGLVSTLPDQPGHTGWIDPVISALTRAHIELVKYVTDVFVAPAYVGVVHSAMSLDIFIRVSNALQVHALCSKDGEAIQHLLYQKFICGASVPATCGGLVCQPIVVCRGDGNIAKSVICVINACKPLIATFDVEREPGGWSGLLEVFDRSESFAHLYKLS